MSILRSSNRFILISLTILVFALTSNAVYAVTLDFDGFSGSTNFGSVTEDGYTVVGSGPGNHYLSTGGASFCGPPCPQNGTTYLLGHGDLFTITAADSSAFSFFSFDGAETHEGLPSLYALAIRAIGTRADSSVVVQDFTLDFIQDGDGPLNDFQSFAAIGFTDLVSLSLEGIGGSINYFSADNINLSSISAVPVPAAVWLFGTALVGLVGFGKRKARIAA